MKKRKIVYNHRYAQKNKVENGSSEAKVELRKWLVSELGGDPTILDCFCARGEMWKRAYGRTEKYLGLDLNQYDDERRTIVTDCRRFLRHVNFDVTMFDLFDVDAFGSPMEALAMIGHRLGQVDNIPLGRKFGFAITDGSGFAARMRSMNNGVIAYLGLESHMQTNFWFDHRDEVIGMAIDKALQTGRLRTLEARRATKHTGAWMQYIGVLAERI